MRTRWAPWALRLGLLVWALGFCCTAGLRERHRPEPDESPEQTQRILVLRAAFAAFPSLVALIPIALGTYALRREGDGRGSAIAGVALAALYLVLVWGIGPLLH